MNVLSKMNKMMKSRVIVINETYSEFIDVLKGVAILFVLLNHTIPTDIKKYIGFDLWAGLGVPLFLLIQSFHFFKKKDYAGIHYSRILTKLIIPYLIAQISVFVIKCTLGVTMKDIFGDFCESLGFGPGEYYIWIYLQFLLLLPFVGWVFKSLSQKHVWIISIICCMALEIFCSYTIDDDHVYKFLFFRYSFILFLGYLWGKYGIVLNMVYMLLTFVSIVSIIVFDYIGMDLEPIFYNSLEWKCFHWIIYFYPFALLPFILRKIYLALPEYLKSVLISMGRNSWYIFCLQIVVFSFMSKKVFRFIGNDDVAGFLYLICSIMLSIVLVIYPAKLSHKLKWL